jgi:hypothetical protein
MDWPESSTRQTRAHFRSGQVWADCLSTGIESRSVYLNGSTGQPDFPNLLLNLRTLESADFVSCERQTSAEKVAFPFLSLRQPRGFGTSSMVSGHALRRSKGARANAGRGKPRPYEPWAARAPGGASPAPTKNRRASPLLQNPVFRADDWGLRIVGVVTTQSRRVAVIETPPDFFKQTVTFPDRSASKLSVLLALETGLSKKWKNANFSSFRFPR